jgi:tetratricopeptide (TPR) repeat protein
MFAWLGNLFSRLGNWIFARGVATGDTDPRHTQIWQQLLVIESFTIRFYALIALFILLYSFGQISDLVDSSDWRQAASVLGILVGVVTASTIAGGFIGFLFGLPKQVQPSGAGSQDEPPATRPTADKSGLRRGAFFRGNSNLEEVSDWVTKIIVGLGLVEAKSLYDALASAADAFKEQALPEVVGADIVFLTIVIAASCAGFIVFYLETRTRIALLFVAGLVDHHADVLNRQNLIDAAGTAPIIEPPSSSGGQQPQQAGQARGAAPIPEDEALLQVPYEALRTSQQINAWASAQARKGNYEVAARALEDAIKKNPNDPDLLLRLADVRQRQGDQTTALSLVREVQQKSKVDDPELLKRELMISLYLNPPESFTKAIEIANQLLASPQTERDPEVQVWAAAAHGQKYAYLVTTDGDQAQKAEARNRALEAVRRAIQLTKPSDPSRDRLRRLFDPEREGSTRWENDLEVFKDDAEFRSLIYPDG